MFTNKDIEHKTIFVINCIKDRDLRVKSGELFLEDIEEKKTLTKLPFQKILAIFIVGHIRITTPLIDKCRQHNISLIVTKPSFRPVFYWSNAAEANYLLREKQHYYDKSDISIAKVLVLNKIENQKTLLTKTKKKDDATISAIECCNSAIDTIDDCNDYSSLMGLEGLVSKQFFKAYYAELGWTRRIPRSKIDTLNTTLDIGYTILFNYIECFMRMFGFDLYIGVYHRLWFKRKSLVCDIIEPFRCIIDKTMRTAYKKKQFTIKDFKYSKDEYLLKTEMNAKYMKVFFDALIPYKTDVFKYVREYYRAFMKNAKPNYYPKFKI